MNPLLPLVLIGSLTSTPLEPRADDTLTKRLETIAMAFHERRDFHGAVLVGRGDSVLLRLGLGLANIDEKIPNRSDTRFRLASVTKQFTAAAVMRLVERGELDLDEPLETYLPRLDNRLGTEVSLHHLLSHSSGAIRDVDNLTPKDMGDHFHVSEMITLLAGTDLLFEPGARFSYSNAGFVMAAAVIEAVTGQSYGTAMSELIFTPLGMSGTGHEVARTRIEKRAVGSQRLPDSVIHSEYEDKSYVTGAGSIYSTVDDLWIWSRALVDDRLLSAESREMLFEEQSPGHGYGWFLNPYQAKDGEGNTIDANGVTHGGGCPGFSTDIALYLDHDLTVIVLSNRLPSDVGNLKDQLARAVLGFEDPLPAFRTTDEVYVLALKGDIDAATELWSQRIRSDAPPPRPTEINRLGYDYLRAHRFESAVRLFELYVATSPTNANAHDSLGEGLMAAGRHEEALRSYRHSQRLGSSNSRVGELIAELEKRVTR